MFGDEIDPAAVGLLDTQGQRVDQLLRERAAFADVIARVTMRTVTTETTPTRAIYRLGVSIEGEALREVRTGLRDLELVVGEESRAYKLVRAYDATLRGRSFLAFMRFYQTPFGAVQLHWYLAADTEATVAATRNAIALAELLRPEPPQRPAPASFF